MKPVTLPGTLPALYDHHKYVSQIGVTLDYLNARRDFVTLPHNSGMQVVTKYDSKSELGDDPGVLTAMYFDPLKLSCAKTTDAWLVKTNNRDRLELMTFDRESQRLFRFAIPAGMITETRPDLGLLVHWLSTAGGIDLAEGLIRVESLLDQLGEVVIKAARRR